MNAITEKKYISRETWDIVDAAGRIQEDFKGMSISEIAFIIRPYCENYAHANETARKIEQANAPMTKDEAAEAIRRVAGSITLIISGDETKAQAVAELFITIPVAVLCDLQHDGEHILLDGCRCLDTILKNRLRAAGVSEIPIYLVRL